MIFKILGFLSGGFIGMECDVNPEISGSIHTVLAHGVFDVSHTENGFNSTKS